MALQADDTNVDTNVPHIGQMISRTDGDTRKISVNFTPNQLYVP